MNLRFCLPKPSEDGAGIFYHIGREIGAFDNVYKVAETPRAPPLIVEVDGDHCTVKASAAPGFRTKRETTDLELAQDAVDLRYGSARVDSRTQYHVAAGAAYALKISALQDDPLFCIVSAASFPAPAPPRRGKGVTAEERRR